MAARRRQGAPLPEQLPWGRLKKRERQVRTGFFFVKEGLFSGGYGPYGC